MKISESMVEFYLTKVTNLWIIDHGVPPYNPSEYDDYYIEDIKQSAIYRDDLDTLKLALEHIMSNPEIDTGRLADSEYDWEDEEVRELIRYIWNKIWPDSSPIPPGGPPGVKLVKMSLKEWWARWKGTE
jgi:hypothetical protein